MIRLALTIALLLAPSLAFAQQREHVGKVSRQQLAQLSSTGAGKKPAGGGGGSVSYDNVGAGGVAATLITVINWLHSPNATPTCVIVGMGIYYYGVNVTATITYDSVTLGESSAYVNGPTVGDSFRGVIQALANPNSGASKTVEITLSNVDYIAANSITVTGSSTSTCLRTSTTNNANANGTTTVAITGTSGDLIVNSTGQYRTPSSPTVSGGTSTSVYAVTHSSNQAFGMGYAAATGSSQNSDWNINNPTGTVDWVAIAVAVQP